MTTTEELRAAVQSLFDSHQQEIDELAASNVEDFFYEKHAKQWRLIFKKGEDQYFDSKQEMLDWIRSDGND